MKLLTAVLLFSVSFLVAQERDFFRVMIHSDVDYVVVNPDGKKSGFDPTTKTTYKQINDSYGVMSVDSEDPDIDPPPPVYEFVDDEPISGEYMLTLHGTSLSKFNLFVLLTRSLEDGERKNVIGIIDSNQTTEYVVRYDRSPGKPYVVEKVIENRTLRRDLENCYKLQFLGGKPLYIDLNHRVEKYEGWIQKADTAKARQELKKLEKKLDEVYEKSKGPSKDPNHFIKEEAYRILKEDVMGLMRRSTN